MCSTTSAAGGVAWVDEHMGPPLRSLLSVENRDRRSVGRRKPRPYCGRMIVLELVLTKLMIVCTAFSIESSDAYSKRL